MNNNLLKEVQYRCLFIFLNWFFFTNLLYYYKEVVFFIILKKLSYLENLEFYLVYTDVTELFSIYLKLINFCNLQITLNFLFYHIVIFCIPALYKKEFKTLINLFFLFILVNNLYIILFSKLFPLLVDFLKNFQEPYIYFEIKVNEIFNFIVKIFLYFQFIFMVLMLVFFSSFSRNIIKLRKLTHFLLVLTLIFSFNTLNIASLFTTFICYELLLFLSLLKVKVKG